MREWRLTANDPMAPRIAADARTGRTNYHDDQIWQLRLGQPDEPAVSLETRYGGRVGLARLMPIWFVGRRQMYEAQAYHKPPVLTAFAPDFLRLKADLTLTLALTLEFWTMESQAVGGRFICRNTGSEPQSLRMDLSAQAAYENRTLEMMFLTLENNQVALQLGRMENFQPVLMLENATGTSTQARLTSTATIPPGRSVVFRWVQAAMPDRNSSLLLAHRWLALPDWDTEIAAIERRADAQPQIETGDTDWDVALAWSQQITLRSFLSATNSLPHPSFVSSRKPNQGFPASGVHTGGFRTPWGGQTIQEAILIAPEVARSAPELAKGIVRNFLAVQRDDGWIDARPGLDGQRTNVLAPPLLASLAYTVYQYTGDKAFLGDCLDGLLAFFDRWFKPDMDRDRDGMPEWSDIDQGAFADSPTLAQNRRWAQGVDITTIEAPDLAAYMVREAQILIRIAGVLKRDDIVQELTPRHEALLSALNDMWDNERGRFQYRDRDSNSCPAGELVFQGKGDQPLHERTALPMPSRLILRAIGGINLKPKLGCTIEGIDANGKAANETIPHSAFTWYRGMGSATTKTVWRELTYLKFDGLSRVYTIEANTVNLSHHDQALFMPLWTGALDAEREASMIAMLTDPAQYWREFGISACPANDPVYDATHQNGCGGMWPDWNTFIAWALLDLGHRQEAAALFERVIRAQIRTLATEQTFRAFYNPDTGEGLGDSEVLSGIVSLNWFGRLFGAYVLDSTHAVITDPFAFEDRTIRWTQHGVTIERSADGTKITFPSGHTSKLKPDAEAQVIRDGKTPRKPRKQPADAPKPDTPQPPDEGLLPATDA